MLQLSETKLHNIRQQISRQVAFPEELSQAFDEVQAGLFLREVEDCRTEAELQDFATLLPRRRLNDLFGAMLVMSAASGESPVIKLLSVLKQRITPSLAEIAWAFYQNHYPNDRMNRALATVVRELDLRGINLPYTNIIKSVADMPIIDDTLPQRLAEYYLQKQAQEEPLPDYLVRLTILPDSPFAASFLAGCFLDCQDQLFARDGDLYVHALRQNDKEIQQKLLTHYLARPRLQDEWEPINTALLEEYGQPRPRRQQKIAALLGRSSDARIWDTLDMEVVDNYRRWEMFYRLNLHSGYATRKKLFYQNIRQHMREISRWDDKTLVLHFDHFYLVDYAEEDDRLYYYDLNTYQVLSEATGQKKPLHKPDTKPVTARDAILSGHRHNIVAMQLDAINLLYSRDFLSEKLDPKNNSLV